MKSRITVEVDFENGNRPILQLIRKHSDDTRDSLINAFLEGRGHQSRWLRIEYKGDVLDGGSRFHINVIGTNDLPEESELMQATLRASESVDPVDIPSNILYIACDERDPDICGTYTSTDGRNMCNVKQLK